jgi:general secretion pathway protein A
MYEKYFNFSEKPFNTTPDSKFFFPSAKHTEALNSLLYAITERKGFIVITGEIGSGKTTVCRTLLNKLDINTKVALITNTHLTAKELIAEILEELEIEHNGGSKQKLLSHLNQYLVKQLASDMNVVLIIDEAQNLAPKVLEEVRMLSNLETEKEKLIQIILLGQPQLKVKLENPKLEQFKQRIALYYHLVALTPQESHDYIYHRLRLASLNGVADIFTPEALNLIYQHSKGIPRLINLYCDSALLSGYIYETRNIDEKIISEVVKEREFTHTSDAEAQYSIPSTHDEQHNTDDIQQKTQYAILNTQYENITTHCCNNCQNYKSCAIKWNRGLKGEDQLCCPTCKDYQNCINHVKTVKLN